MSTKTLIIYNSPILFDILEEIKDNFNFNIIKSDTQNFNNLKFNKNQNYAIISDKTNQIQNCHKISTPIKIDKILEKINILFISNQFLNQSYIKIGEYILDLNSRTISKKETFINLTEKETEIISYIHLNKFVSLKDLQVKVWKHSSDLETHTVETHIYRLRKKFLDTFEDKNFIKHDKKGYYLN